MNWYENDFWTLLDELVKMSQIVIDRPKGSCHPRFPHLIYPVDYGYLSNTASMDRDGIDVWVGADPLRQINGILCTVDRMKKDSEIKILIGCTEKETKQIYEFHNNSSYMKGLWIPKERTSDDNGREGQ